MLSFQNEQYERYKKRAKEYENKGECIKANWLLVVPSFYCEGQNNLIVSTMILTKLKQLYADLRKHKEDYYIFEFVKNQKKFEILFDIFKTPFELHFVKKADNYHLKLNVQRGFIIDEKLNFSDYKKLCQILELRYDPNNKFSPKTFFEEFNSKIPNYTYKEKKQRELFNFYKSDIEEVDKLYFDGFIEWNKSDTGKNVSQKNLKKTRVLYPDLYEKCKRENLSIRYRADKKDT